jgi:hypothetical protein
LGDSITSIWDNEFRVGKPHEFAPGKYSLKLLTSGIAFRGTHCHLFVHYNDSLLGSFYTQENYQLSPEFKFTVNDTKSFVIKVGMDNDGNDAKTKEDRNAFIKAIYFTKE